MNKIDISGVKIVGADEIRIPKFLKVKQDIFSNPLVIDKIPEVVREEISGSKLADKIKKGDKIAITAGSRGIDKLAVVVKEVVKVVKELGAEPFIVPAMGSHGGATAEGQKKILKKYGIEEDKVDAPIRASMEVVKLGVSPSGLPVYTDKTAYNSDGIIVINRVKVHTRFSAENESGVVKMMVIGLGNHKGANTVHKEGVAAFPELIPEIGKEVLENAPIMLGLGLLEDGRDKLYKIKAMDPENIFEEEKKMLKEMKGYFPEIPFDRVDLLIVDEIGKDISGAGMDTNVIGRKKTVKVDIGNIIVLDLSENTNGAAVGMGLADITTEKLFKKIDFNSTYNNMLTTTHIDSARVPLVLKNDKMALIAGIKCSKMDSDKIKIVRIKNTLELGNMWVSEALLNEVCQNEKLDEEGQLTELEFDQDNNFKF